MRPALVVATALAAGTLFAPAAPGPAGAASSCEEPEPTLAYDEDSLDYGLALDLTGCEWWEGGQIELTATLTRFSLLDDAKTATQRLCGVPTAPARPVRDRSGGRGGRDATAEDPADETPADEAPADETPSEDDLVEEAPAGEPRTAEPDEGDEEERDPRYERARVAKCVIDAQLDHGRVEAARYSGEIAYPWEDGTRTVGFSVLCTSGLGRRCTDLP